MIYSEHVRDMAERELVARLEEFQKDPDRWQMKLDEPILGVQALVVKGLDPDKLILMHVSELPLQPMRMPAAPKPFRAGARLYPKKQFVLRGLV